MHLARSAMAALAAAALLLAGCSGDGDDVSPSPAPTSSSSPVASATAAPSSTRTFSPPGHSSVSFVGVVNLRKYGELCDDPTEFCSLPTQFDPAVVDGQTVSKGENSAGQGGWPMQGDKIEVLCRVTGQQYHTTDRIERRDWYGVRIPSNRLEPDPGTDRAPVKLDEGYLAYVQGATIMGRANGRLPGCSLFDPR